MRIKSLALISLSLVLAGVAYGQKELVKANIPFPFNVEGKVLPAGQYIVTTSGSSLIRVASTDGKSAGVLALITRLSGAMHTTPKDSHLVFDKVGETNFLSEVWIPGSDGYLVNSTAKEHEHRIIDVPR